MTTIEKTPKKVEGTNFSISWLNDNTIHLFWKEGADIEISDIDELEKVFADVTQGKKVKVVSELGNYVNMSTEARHYAASRSPELIGLAYVINGLAQRIVLRFYIRLRKRKNPVKVFDSMEDAKEWLHGL